MKVLNKIDENTLELLVYGDIDSGGSMWGGVSASDIIAQIKDASPKKLNVRVNSGGGSVFEGVAIYNYLKDFEGKVHVTVDGVAASIASVIMLAGDVIEISEGAMVMIHEASLMAYGNSEDFEKAMNLLKAANTSIVDIYANRTGLDKDKLAEMMKAETWMTSDEAVSNGFADKVKKGKSKASAQMAYKLVAKMGAPKHVINNFNDKMDDNKSIFDGLKGFFTAKKEMDELQNSITEPIIAKHKAEIDALNAKQNDLNTKLEAAVKVETDLKTKVTELTNSVSEKDALIAKMEAALKDAGMPFNASKPNEDIADNTKEDPKILEARAFDNFIKQHNPKAAYLAEDIRNLVDKKKQNK